MNSQCTVSPPLGPLWRARMQALTHNKIVWRAWLFLCLFLAGGIWGLTPGLARVATEKGAHALGLTLWQGALAGFGLLAITLIRGKRLPLSRRHVLFYSVCGVVGTALPTSLTFAVSQRVPVSIVAIVLAATPMLTYLIAVILRIDGISPSRLTGIALGFAAVALLIGVSSSGFVGTISTFWLLLGLLIPLSYAAENNIISIVRPAGIDDVTLLTGMLLFGALATLPAVIVTDAFVPFTFPPGRVEWATLAMVVINVVSYASFIYLVRISGPVFASQAGYLTVAVGVGVGILVYHERPSAWVWVATLLLLVGMTLVKERVHREVSTV